MTNIPTKTYSPQAAAFWGVLVYRIRSNRPDEEKVKFLRKGLSATRTMPSDYRMKTARVLLSHADELPAEILDEVTDFVMQTTSLAIETKNLEHLDWLTTNLSPDILPEGIENPLTDFRRDILADVVNKIGVLPHDQQHFFSDAIPSLRGFSPKGPTPLEITH